MKVFILFFSVLLPFLSFAKTKSLTVLTYESIASNWGIGSVWKDEFEKTCVCEVKFIAINTGSYEIINRLTRNDINNGDIDIVLGLDNYNIEQAKPFLQEHNLNIKSSIWQDELSVAFDYGFPTLVGNKDDIESLNLKGDNIRLEDLLKIDKKYMAIPNPKSSALSRMWLRYLYEMDKENIKENWQEFSKKLIAQPASWDETYFLMIAKEVPITLSYNTSPYYHIKEENNFNIIAINFKEPLIKQVELAAIVKTTKQKTLAQEFLMFITSQDAQKHVPNKQIMYSIIEENNQEIHKTIGKYEDTNKETTNISDEELLKLVE